VSLAAAYAIAVVSTPAGISGAVLLLPFQVSVLGTPSPAVTPTNLLYNIIAAPGGLYRYWRQGQAGGHLARVLIAGTLPGVTAGAVIRVELLPGPRVFDLVVAVVLLPLGLWLAFTRPPNVGDRTRPWPLPAPVLVPLAAAVGCAGGIYGIGGGSILAPILIGAGGEPAEVAPAALRRRGNHLYYLVYPPLRRCRARLADRHRPGNRRPGRRLHRRPHPVPPSRCPHPSPGRTRGDRHRRALPVARPELAGSQLSQSRRPCCAARLGP
jgi:hypothetical protein